MSFVNYCTLSSWYLEIPVPDAEVSLGVNEEEEGLLVVEIEREGLGDELEGILSATKPTEELSCIYEIIILNCSVVCREIGR